MCLSYSRSWKDLLMTVSEYKEDDGADLICGIFRDGGNPQNNRQVIDKDFDDGAMSKCRCNHLLIGLRWFSVAWNEAASAAAEKSYNKIFFPAGQATKDVLIFAPFSGVFLVKKKFLYWQLNVIWEFKTNKSRRLIQFSLWVGQMKMAKSIDEKVGLATDRVEEEGGASEPPGIRSRCLWRVPNLFEGRPRMECHVK